MDVLFKIMDLKDLKAGCDPWYIYIYIYIYILYIYRYILYKYILKTNRYIEIGTYWTAS